MAEAREAQDIQDEYAADGFQYLSILIEDARQNTPNQADLESWASQGNFEDVATLGVDSDYLPWPYFEADWAIPTIVHIGPDMTVLSVDEYISDPGRFIE